MTGRPPKYNNCVDFDAMCELYFEECDDNFTTHVTKEGDVIEIPQPDPYLKSGLALSLGLTTETLRAYAADSKHPFSSIVKRCYTEIQNDLEKRSIIYGKQQATGCIFNLKCNFGFKDTSSVELVGDARKPLKWEVEIVRPDDIDGD